MGFTTTNPPLPFRMANAAGAALGTLGISGVHLEEDALLQDARRKTGLADFGDPGFLDGLRALLGSIEHDANLHFVGRLGLRRVILDGLVNRLLLTEEQKRAPERFAGPLIPPLVVLGLPRSGTTFLHRLLAEDPANYASPYWELTRPLPLPGRPDTRRRDGARVLRAGKYLIGDLDRKHFTAADAAEEDVIMLGATFESWYFWSNASVYGYLEWYLSQDHARKYREYRAWLQVLQAAHPGRRLVLKSPEHTGGLSALLRAVPEALPVQLHRDPVTAFASYVSLTRTGQVALADAVDPARNAAANLRLLAEEADRNLAARDANPGAVLDVYYDDLTADPVGVVDRVYGHHGLTPTDAGRGAMDRYAKENPRGKHGAHRYAVGDTGLGEDAVRARFAAYNERFGFATGRGASGR